MTRVVSEALNLKWNAVRPPGRGANAHRADVFVYHAMGLESVGIEIERGLLETGYGDGWQPQELITVEPLIARGLSDVDPAAYEDLAAVTLPALRPVRTLIEKMHALHSAVTEWSETQGLGRDARRIA